MTLAALFGLVKTIFSIFFVLGSIALVHEFGHYITAKLTGIWVYEFAIGFGTRLLKVKWGETVYSLRMLPLGGFVSLAGMDSPEEEGAENENKDQPGKDPTAAKLPEGHPAGPVSLEKKSETSAEPEEDEYPRIDPTDPRGFPIKPRWVKILVLSAGSFMNIVWAVALFFCIYLFSDNYLSNIGVRAVAKGQPAEAAGIKAGDVISHIDGIAIEEWSEGIKMIRERGGQPMTVDILRDHPQPKAGFGGGLLQGDFAINRGTFSLSTLEKVKIKVTPAGTKGYGQIGIALEPYFDYKQVRPLTWDKALVKGFYSTYDIIDQTVTGIIKMFVGAASADVAGPVKIMQMIKDQARKGIFELLYLTALLTVNIGMINMMPFPVLDGGRIVFVLLETIFSFINMLTGLKLAITPRVEENVHFVGMMFLLLVLVLVTYKDIRSFF